MSKVLIVDDEPAIREMIALALIRGGFTFQEAGDTEKALDLISAEPPDLILLDWMLPGQSGLDFARYLKRGPVTRNLPIIMLTARGEERDKVQGLEMGADDYITKPFSPRELLARIKAVLRRVPETPSEHILSVEGLTLDVDSHRVSTEGKFLELGPIEFRLLHFLMEHMERVYTRTQLLEHVWGGNVYVEERTVDVHIRRLRKTLESSGHDRLVQTVRGTGYRFSSK
ncbi:MAG: phosphate regulon transcriptional regulatory protein PhoB [Gammaproteobacteria bacterium]|nr:phosphate regulon transcriptional regulatory protein PhoB [Gammaproteobacteria bacterium]